MDYIIRTCMMSSGTRSSSISNGKYSSWKETLKIYQRMQVISSKYITLHAAVLVNNSTDFKILYILYGVRLVKSFTMKEPLLQNSALRALVNKLGSTWQGFRFSLRRE